MRRIWVMLRNELRRAASLSWLALLACSGPAFHLVSGAQGGSSGDAGKFPGLVETSNPPGDGGSAGESPANSNPTGGSGSMTPPDGGSGGPTAGSSAGDASTTPDASAPVRSTPCGNPRENTTDLDDGEACIAAGTFSMGSMAPVNSGAGYAAHGPPHMVTLSAYFLDVYEVTVARYRQCVSANLCAAPSTDPSQGCTYTADAGAQELYPVTCVTWQAAVDFCTWDQRRLPTEAEWERAGRSGQAGFKYPWGTYFPSCDHAVVGGGNTSPQCPNYVGQLPKPVRSAPIGVSEDGVYDLSGNAAEWVNDWFSAYSAAAVTDPIGPGSGTTRVQRGGGWRTPSADASGYARQTADPDASGPVSFRCARNAEP